MNSVVALNIRRVNRGGGLVRGSLVSAGADIAGSEFILFYCGLTFLILCAAVSNIRHLLGTPPVLFHKAPLKEEFHKASKRALAGNTPTTGFKSGPIPGQGKSPKNDGLDNR